MICWIDLLKALACDPGAISIYYLSSLTTKVILRYTWQWPLACCSRAFRHIWYMWGNTLIIYLESPNWGKINHCQHENVVYGQYNTHLSREQRSMSLPHFGLYSISRDWHCVAQYSEPGQFEDCISEHITGNENHRRVKQIYFNISSSVGRICDKPLSEPMMSRVTDV